MDKTGNRWTKMYPAAVTLKILEIYFWDFLCLIKRKGTQNYNF
jgi:hypothetical protein